MKTSTDFKGRLYRLLIALILAITLALAGGNTQTVVAATAASIDAGNFHTCAITNDGGVKCWGANSMGQLGNGFNDARNIPVNVIGLSRGAVAISAGGIHTCVLMDTGGIKCWGLNNDGQLGSGLYGGSYNRPVNVIGISDRVVAISAGWQHTCALIETGEVKCWGDNEYGQLGNGTLDDKSSPTNVIGLYRKIVAISAGHTHTCALTDIGGVMCWGDNSYGQLGNGNNIKSSTPGNVVGLDSGIGAISAGTFHTCALTNEGVAKCWGDNSSGQLGNGTNTNSNTPVNVTGLSSGVVAISAGFKHTCAITESGGAKCWGDGTYSQLGNASTGSNVPLGVVELSEGVSTISAGGYHTCALIEFGIAKCWGDNFHGQLGNGNYNQGYIPVNVIGLSDLTIFEHDAHLTERADSIDSTLADIVSTLESLNLNNLDVSISSRASQTSIDALSNASNDMQTKLISLDVPVSSRASQTSVDALSNALNTMQTKLATLEISVSSRASQASVDALSNTVGNIDNKVDDLDARLETIKQKLDGLQPNAVSCIVNIALVPQGEGHNANNLEFYLHTTLSGVRVNPENLTIWVGGEQAPSTNITSMEILAGVTWLMLDGTKWSDLKNQPLTVEVVVSGITCSDLVVIEAK